MLKWNYAINLGVAGVLTVPMLTQGARTDAAADPARAASAAGIERSLDETLRALEVLAGIEKRAAAGDPRASAIARHVTEPAIADARERDQLHTALRDEVSRLQMLHDGFDPRSQSSSTTAATLTPTIDADRAPTIAHADESSSVVITTGLDEAARRALSTSAAPIVAAGTRSLSFAAGTAPSSAPQSHERGATEALGGDPLRQGQACYRAGRYAECLALMKSLGGEVRARYWTGRALEKLDRVDEAILVYREVSEARDAGYLATRAASDLDYLQWKLALAARLAQKARAALEAGSPSQSMPTRGTGP